MTWFLAWTPKLPLFISMPVLAPVDDSPLMVFLCASRSTLTMSTSHLASGAPCHVWIVPMPRKSLLDGAFTYFSLNSFLLTTTSSPVSGVSTCSTIIISCFLSLCWPSNCFTNVSAPLFTTSARRDRAFRRSGCEASLAPFSSVSFVMCHKSHTVHLCRFDTSSVV